ncbi:RDD family protein [Micromonospora pattaloongensis]|uniref:RDD family protein n=1 Tax=Micromonospora pattaloongensis TaxID=405436 RepID=UPI001FE00BF1|nr:RDD family protein [Micromonospora pattaloongensis]
MTPQPPPPRPGPAPPAEPRLVSGEAVELDVRVARVGSRALALMIDIVVQAAIALVLFAAATLVIDPVRPRTDAAVQGALITVGMVLVLVGYPVCAETLSRGRTLGKLALGLRVVRDDGGPIGFRHALTRALVSVAVEWPGLVLPPLTWVASLATMLGHPRGKRLGDVAAGTIVIHERTPAGWGWIPGMPPPLVQWARTLDLTGLDDDLALAVRHFLARGHELAEPARSRLGHALAAEVAAATTPPPPPGVPGWAYLAAVLAERHRRAAQRLARVRAATATLWPGLVSPPPDPARAAAPAPPEAWGSPRPAGVAGAGPERGSSRPAGGAGADPDWPREPWPTPPWLGGNGAHPDWTGMRPPPVASALRRAVPSEQQTDG